MITYGEHLERYTACPDGKDPNSSNFSVDIGWKAAIVDFGVAEPTVTIHIFVFNFAKDRQELISKLSVVITIVATNSLKYEFHANLRFAPFLFALRFVCIVVKAMNKCMMFSFV